MKRERTEDIRVRFGLAVKKRRHELGISQEELADRAGLHRTYIGGIERGRRNLSLENRVADGIYETMLDGMELTELKEHEGIHIWHYLIVDDYFTWWVKGKSYLCRIVDMLHMGLIDEALFGREVLLRWPSIVRSWPKKR